MLGEVRQSEEKRVRVPAESPSQLKLAESANEGTHAERFDPSITQTLPRGKSSFSDKLLTRGKTGDSSGRGVNVLKRGAIT